MQPTSQLAPDCARLFDHNVPKRLRRFLSRHEVKTAREMAWEELENGELLAAAESACFDVMITCDKNLSYQQNLKGRRLALVVLDTNDWNVIKLNSEPIVTAVDLATSGSFKRITLAGLSTRQRRK